jgi:hypothetical protein
MRNWTIIGAAVWSRGWFGGLASRQVAPEPGGGGGAELAGHRAKGCAELRCWSPSIPASHGRRCPATCILDALVVRILAQLVARSGTGRKEARRAGLARRARCLMNLCSLRTTRREELPERLSLGLGTLLIGARNESACIGPGTRSLALRARKAPAPPRARPERKPL